MWKDQDIFCCHSACNSDSHFSDDLYRGGLILSPGSGTARKKTLSNDQEVANQTLSLRSRRTFWVYLLYLYPLRNSMDPVSTVSSLDLDCLPMLNISYTISKTITCYRRRQANFNTKCILALFPFQWFEIIWWTTERFFLTPFTFELCVC